MTSILHRVKLQASAEQVYNALTTADGLKSWWTKADTTAEVNSITRFYFGVNNDHLVDMQITQLIPNQLINWKCVSGPWENTGLFEFVIRPEEQGVMLLFSHHGWQEADEFYMHCNSKWGFFLTVSLKSFLESGTGQPHPNEPDI